MVKVVFIEEKELATVMLLVDMLFDDLLTHFSDHRNLMSWN
jgi:hypothetical protein